jgi:DNA-binding MarR family transcriptional regulator
MPQPPPNHLEAHLGYWLRYVSNHVSHAFTQKLAAKGVTVAEWVVLRELYDLGAVYPSDLAEKLGMTRGAISKLVERLRLKGFARRYAVEDDARYQTIELTPAGKRLTPTLAKLADANDHEFFGHLTKNQRAEVTNLLQDIVQRNGWKDLPVS